MRFFEWISGNFGPNQGARRAHIENMQPTSNAERRLAKQRDIPFIAKRFHAIFFEKSIQMRYNGHPPVNLARWSSLFSRVSCCI